MPAEISPWDGKELFGERKKNKRSWFENVGGSGRSYRWRDKDRDTFRLHHQWRSTEFRRPTGYGKQGWHMYSEDFAGGSGPSRQNKRIFDDGSCLPIGNYRRNSSRDTRRGPFSQRDWRGYCWEAAPEPSSNGCANVLAHGGVKRSADDMLAYNSYPHFNIEKKWDQFHLRDQHYKNSVASVPLTHKRFGRKNSDGSVDWKPHKWTRSGSLSSRGSGFSYSSGPKSLSLDSGEIKVALHPQNPSPVHYLSAAVAACATSAPAEESNLQKKPRLGWGEGLAKFEKVINGSTDISEINGPTEPVHSDNSNAADRSSKVQCFTECPSPATPSSFACCSSPGEDKLFVKAVNVDTANLCGSPESQNQRDGLAFNLENSEVTTLVKLSSSLSELLQSINLHSVDSGFIRSSAVSNLLVLKADIAKELEVTESEIDSLDNELKILSSEAGCAGPCPTSSSSLPVKCILKPLEELRATSNLIPRPAPLGLDCSRNMMKKSSGRLEGELAESRDEDIDSPGTATSKVVEPLSARTPFSEEKTLKCGKRTWNVDTSVDEDREGKSIVYAVSEESRGATLSNQIASSRVCMLSTEVGVRRVNMLYDLLIASNKDSAYRAAEVFSQLLPANLSVVNYSNFDVSLCWKNKALIREYLVLRKRFLRFKERVITLKYRTFQHMWKEDLRRLFTRRSGSKFQKKFELSSSVVYSSNLKHRSSICARFSSRAGNLSLVPTAEVINFASKLLADSHVKIYRSALKMPSLVLDNVEKIASRFISNNGLVEDPFAAENVRCMLNPWTSKEKEIFLDKLVTFGKDFRKIASFLDHKTTADCIEFYYKNHKSDFFQRIKKKPEFPKKGRSCSTSTFLVTSGKRSACIINAASLDMLGAASAIVAHVDDSLNGHQKCPKKVFGTCDPRTWGDDGMIFGMSQSSSNPDVVGNEIETVAADVLAGVCGSLSSEAMSSCITTLKDFGEGYKERKGQHIGSSVRQPSTPEVIHNTVSETCSDESCGEIDPTIWTDKEKSNFVQAVASYGKDFTMISRYVKTRSSDQCKVFFSKARKCLRLDMMYPGHCQGKLASDDANSGGGSDSKVACVVDTSSVICNKKSGSRMDEDQLLSKIKENPDGIQPAGTTKMQPDFDHLEELNRMKTLDVKDTKRSTDKVFSGNHAVEKAELDLDAGNNFGNCFHSDTKSVKNDTIVREDNDHGIPSIAATVLDIKAEGEVYGDTSRAEDVGHGISIPCCSLNSKRVGFDDVKSGSLGSICCSIQGTETITLSATSASLDIGIDTSAKGVLLGDENKNVKLMDPLRKPPIVSLKQCSSYKSQNPVFQDYVAVQSKKSLNHDMTSQFDSKKSSNKQFQDSVSTDKYHKLSCKNPSVDRVDPSQILRGYPVSISTKNNINGGVNCTKPVSAQSKSKVADHFLAQRCDLQKCNSSKQHQDAESKLHCLSKDHPGRPKPKYSSVLNKTRQSGDVKLFGKILSHPSNSRAPDQDQDSTVAKLTEKFL